MSEFRISREESDERRTNHYLEIERILGDGFSKSHENSEAQQKLLRDLGKKLK